MIATWRKIPDLLTRRQRLRFGLLVLLMAAMAASDLAGVALVLPFLAIVANPDVVENREWLSAAYESFGFADTFAFLQALGFLVFVIVMASIAIRALTFHQVTVFARGAAMTLGAALLRRYLSQPYVWFLRQHSADLGKTILEEVHDVTVGAIAPAMRLLANVMVLTCLFGLLIALEPVGALVMGVFLCAGFAVIYVRLDAFLARTGRDRRVAKREKHQITAEAMTGIKEVKVMGLEDAYLRRFIGPSERVARHQATVTLLGEMPRYVLEALAFGGMLLFVLWLLHSREGRLDEALPVIGAFAFAGLKLMPTVQQIFQDLAQLRHNEPTLDGLRADLAGTDIEGSTDGREHRRGGVAPIPLTRELRLEGVGYRYPDAAHGALHGVDLTVPIGSSVGVVGASGAGKTTAMDIILGLLQPDEGRLLVDGTAIDATNVRAWQRGIGYVPQVIHLIDDAIAANIAFGEPAGRIDRAAVERAGRLASLAPFVETLPEGYDTWIGEGGVRLSGGQRQRIGIARALYRDPDLVVFDEATSALDTMTERAVIDAIRALSGRKTIVMVTHRLSTVAHCDRIAVLSEGRLVGTGDHATLAATNATYRALLEAAEGRPAERDARPAAATAP
ncbi:MAG: ABC transporter ATP-binding protein [Paracoccaceae bacterium]